jgi:hypothetical protein
VVFVNVLLQGGLPIPTYPTLILAGAILARPGHSAPARPAGVAAAMVADSLWYVAGRYGMSVLGVLCRVSLTRTLRAPTSSTFNRYDPSLLGSHPRIRGDRWRVVRRCPHDYGKPAFDFSARPWVAYPSP